MTHDRTDTDRLMEICRRLECEFLYVDLKNAVEQFNYIVEDLAPLQSLESWYDLDLPGVRALLREYLTEFAEIFKPVSRLRIYASVPMPYAMSICINSTGNARIYTAEYCVMVVMGGVFGLNVNSYTTKSCGSCAMLDNRLGFVSQGILPRPDVLLSFGLLCDECCKTDEILRQDGIDSVTIRCPHNIEERFTVYEKDIEAALSNIEKISGKKIVFDREQRALWMRTQLLISMISCKNNRCPSSLLKPGSISLISSIALTSFGKPEAVERALDRIWEDMKSIQPRKRRPKLYCYYIPPCVPRLGEMFRENGIDLVGDSAFISLPIEGSNGNTLPRLCADSWRSSVLSRSNEEYAQETAKKIRQNDCCGYLTGMFSFDRWLGNGHSLTNRYIEKLSGKPVHTLHMDFWGRDFSTTHVLNYVQTICAAIVGEREVE